MSAYQSVNPKAWIKAITGMALAVAAWGNAFAVDTTWSYGGLSSGSTYTACSTGACIGTTLTGLSNAIAESGNSYNTNNSTTDFSAASVYSWGGSGLGVVRVGSNPTTTCTSSGTGIIEDPNCTGPHAIDNVYGTDALVVGFGALKVNLNSLSIGWNGNDNGGGSYTDSDLSVFAWVGSAAMSTANVSPTDLKAQSDALAAGTITSGWKLIGNYADVGASNGTTAGGTQNLASTVYSSNWLISAYNSSYGSTNSSGRGSLTGFNDEFKLLSLKGASCDHQLTGNSCGPGQVPEPSGLMLLGLGLLGLATSRKWQARREQHKLVIAA